MADSPAPGPAGRRAAFFDVDGTIADTTIAHYFRYLMLRRLSPLRGRIWYAGFLVRCGFYILLDKLDRGRLNRVFYRNYRGLPVDSIKAMAADCHEAVTNPRRFTQAGDCIAQHRADGDLIVLVTGSLDFIMEPLAKQLGADSVVAAQLAEEGGRFTGSLVGPPVGSREKARRMQQFALSAGIDLRQSHAYGDSISDLAMLEAVGFPHAVNPDRTLAAIARQRGWPIHRWSCGRGPSRNGQ
jgi:HAD superfamily hydrolase (TIGR01490 family)